MAGKSKNFKAKLKQSRSSVRRVTQLERFTLSGDIGGERSFSISGRRNRSVQVITVGVISSASLVLKGARFNFQNRNMRLRVQVRGSRAFWQSTSNKQDFPNLNRVLFTESAEARGVELVVSVVNVSGNRAVLCPQDGWWLDFALNKRS